MSQVCIDRSRPSRLSPSRCTLDPRLRPTYKIGAARLAHISAEVGARFLRERIDLEPLQWLASPRKLFDGRSALTACSTAEGFRRATALHGLSLGLDADPSTVMDVPIDPFLSDAAQSYLTAAPPPRPKSERRRNGPLSLYCCAISVELDDEQVQIFCAMVARSPVEVRTRLRRRYGPMLEDEAKVILGFDGSEPLACALVSDAMAELLSLAADNPSSELARGLDFAVEQRFVA